ncbi:MAG: cell filamentation protein Fic [Ramlibacter sp.]|jgi:hypothetical protein|nr:cell filamentation protein Fic [Ramlibacter sp.]
MNATAAEVQRIARVYRNTDQQARAVAETLARSSRELTTDEVLDQLGMSPSDRPKALRWLDRASVTGLVQRVEEKGVRGFRWRAADAVQRDVSRQRLDRPLAERPRVGYNCEFLDSYEPGRTFYLSSDARKRLHARSRPGTAAFEDLSSHDKSVFLCGLSHGSSALEGNPYSRLETIKLIEEGLQKKGASEKETFMVLNHHDAVRYVVNNMHYPPLNNDVHVRGEDIRNIHALLSYHLLDDVNMCGALRTKAVTIFESSFTPLSYPEDLKRCFQMICDKAQKIDDPFEAAFFLLVHLPYLQPFEDCNKRTSRVACNIPLLRKGVLPMSWVDVDIRSYQDGLVAVYEQTSPALLAEVFFDGYMRSTEEFESIRVRPLDGPNEIALRYRNEIRAVVQTVVHEGHGAVPETVDPADQARFGLLVRGELERLARRHAGTMVQYGMNELSIRAWREREAGDAGCADEVGVSADLNEDADRDTLALPLREVG